MIEQALQAGVLYFALGTRIGLGLIALGLLLVAECGVVLWLRGLTVRKYIAERDPVAGTVYLVMLAVYALMPVLVAGK